MPCRPTAPPQVEDGICQYFERALLNERPRGVTLDNRVITVLSEDAVVVSGLDATTAVREGRTVRAPGA